MKVHAPNKGYTGVSASVAFCNGVGETNDPHLLDWFRDRGYAVEEPGEPPKEEATPEPEPDPEPEKKKAAGKKAGE